MDRRSFLTLIAIVLALAVGFYAGAWYTAPHTSQEELQDARRTMRTTFGCGLSDANYELWWKSRDDHNCLTITQVNKNQPLYILRLRPSTHAVSIEP